MILRLALIFSVSYTMGLKINDPCVTPCGVKGSCIPAASCHYAIQIIRNTNSNFSYNASRYLDQSKCGFMEGPLMKPLTCCPNWLNPERCGVADISTRIFGGEHTELGEHPWAALLMYQVDTRKVVPGCGGSLLNSRFVLSAAHCIMDIPRKWNLIKVRFSEWNSSKTKNCTFVNEEEICRQEYGIEKVIVHPNYSKSVANKLHDIAILKLEQEVVFGKYVKPICLPLTRAVRTMPISGQEFTVTGWGRTEHENRSSKQKHVDLNGTSNEVCDEAFSKINARFGNTHICVGGSKGLDSCQGDSGGPLMRQVYSVWYQVGIVSFGTSNCGSKGIPGVYTYVQKYLTWITEVIHVNHCDVFNSE